MPTVSRDSETKISRCELYHFFETLIPGKAKEARVISRKNVAVDATIPAAVLTLLVTSVLCGMAVRSSLHRGMNKIAGVIQDVDNDIHDSYPAGLVLPTTNVVSERHRVSRLHIAVSARLP